MSAARTLPSRPEPDRRPGFGGAVALAGHVHTRRCWWHPCEARWVCPRRPTPPA